MKSLADLMGQEYEKRLKDISEESKSKIADLKKIDDYASKMKNKLKTKGVYGIEKSMVGDRVIVHKKDEVVKIYSCLMEDITQKNDSYVKLLNEFKETDFIVDCMLTSKLDKPIIYLYDVVCYRGQNLFEELWCKRKGVLRKMSFSDEVKEIPMVVVNNQEELENAVKLMSNFPDSKSVYIKSYDGKYSFDEHSFDWIEVELVADGKDNKDIVDDSSD